MKKSFINERNIYLTSNFIMLLIGMIMAKLGDKTLAFVFLSLPFLMTMPTVYYYNNHLKPVREEYHGSESLARRIWNLEYDETIKKITKNLANKYTKLKSFKKGGLTILRYRGRNRMYEFYRVYFIICEEIDEAKYNFFQDKIKKEIYETYANYAVIFVVKKHSYYYEKCLTELPSYQPKNYFGSTIAKTSLSTCGICFENKILTFSLIPYTYYHFLLLNINNIILKI